MTSWRLRSLAPRDWVEVAEDLPDVTGWCWAGHDGMVISDEPPPDIVPTGVLWGWGPSCWVRWRIDAVAPCVGAELRRIADGHPNLAATLSDDAVTEYVVPVCSEAHMLTWAPSARRVNAPLNVINVNAGGQLTFMGFTSEPAGGP